MYVVALAALAVPATAQKGVLGIGADPAQGVTDVDDGARYTALPAGAGTLVTKLDTNGAGRRAVHLRRPAPLGACRRLRRIAGWSLGRWANARAHPAGHPLPADDERIHGRLDTRRLKVLDTVTLDGTFTFDALSPDGRQMYLIEYTSPRDLTQYSVRAYDLERERLLPEPIIDPNESGEEMAGFPQTRATSPDGRWAYTLYESAERDHPPFIHALDTKRGTAVCIDLDPLADQRGIMAARPAAEPRRVERSRWSIAATLSPWWTSRTSRSASPSRRPRPRTPTAAGRRGRRSVPGSRCCSSPARWSRCGDVDARCPARKSSSDSSRPRTRAPTRIGPRSNATVTGSASRSADRARACRAGVGRPRRRGRRGHRRAHRVVGSPGGARARCHATPPGAAEGDRDDRPLERRKADPRDRAERRPEPRHPATRRPPRTCDRLHPRRRVRGDRRACEVRARLSSSRRWTGHGPQPQPRRSRPRHPPQRPRRRPEPQLRLRLAAARRPRRPGALGAGAVLRARDADRARS